MKKIFAIAAVAALVFSACSEIEPISNKEESREIAFDSFSHKTTKATIRTIDDVNTFNVLGFHNNGTSSVSYFNTTATKGQNTSAQDYWGTPVKYYWPAGVTESAQGETMTFFGIVRTGGFGTNVSYDAYAETKVYPSFSYTASAPGTQEDILVAEAVETGYVAQVPMTFNHALSQIEFQVAGKPLDQKVKYTIEKITVGLWESNDATEPGDHKHQIVTKGTYTFGNGYNFKHDQGYCWDINYDSDKTGYTLSLTNEWKNGKEVAANGDLSYSAAMTDGTYMVLPQYFKSMLIAVTFKAEVYGTDGTSLIKIFEGTRYADLASTQLRLWQPGKKYVYQLILDPTGKGQGDPDPYGPTPGVPEDPDDPDSPSIPDPEDPDPTPSTPGDPDPDVPEFPDDPAIKFIEFSVTVENWEVTTQPEINL